jgi:hypothetical protein
VRSRGRRARSPSLEQLRSAAWTARRYGLRAWVHRLNAYGPEALIDSWVDAPRSFAIVEMPERSEVCRESSRAFPLKISANFAQPIHDYLGRNSSRIMVFDVLFATPGPSLPLPANRKHSLYMFNNDLEVRFRPALPFACWVFPGVNLRSKNGIGKPVVSLRKSTFPENSVGLL